MPNRPHIRKYSVERRVRFNFQRYPQIQKLSVTRKLIGNVDYFDAVKLAENILK